MRKPWNEPVLLASQSGELWVITTTEEAYRCLVSGWPRADGEAFYAALEVCNKVENETIGREVARQAFVEAVIEAGIPFYRLNTTTSIGQ